MATGVADISTLLAARFQSVAAFGMDTIQKVLDADLAAHNIIVNDLVSGLCDFTTERLRKYGTSVTGAMVEVDEYGRAPTQIDKPGSTAGFPLRLFQYPIGWTRKWMETKTPADMAIMVQAAQKSHLQMLQREIKRSIFLSANYTYNDFLIDKVDLAVKRLVNADSANIPDGPQGQTFDGTTHTHYLARAGASLAKSDVTTQINHVVEHGYGNMVKIAINRADETTWRALSGFQAYPDPRMTFRVTDTPAQTLDITRLDNRAIGILDAAEIWVKPWGIANYAFAWDAGTPEKPLAFRQRAQQSLQGLRIVAEIDTFPLHAQYMEAEFGLGVWTRTNGAVLYYGNTTYADPTIN